MTYQTLYNQKKVPLNITAGNGVVIWRAEDLVPDNDYVLVVRAFPRVKNTSSLKREWEDFLGKTVGGARWKIRVSDPMTARACISSPADLGA
jgi:hypothetical protein